MSTQQTRQTFITSIRQKATILQCTVDELHALRVQWDQEINSSLVDANGNDPNALEYQPGDFAGSNQGLMKSDLSAVIGTTLDALEALLLQGHGTNLQKIRL